MTWLDAMSLAWTGVRRRLGRLALTVLAVALAGSLLTALLTISTTARTRVLGELAKGGPLAGIKVAAAAPVPGRLDSDNPAPGPAREIDPAALGRITELPRVRAVVPIIAVPSLLVPTVTPADAAGTASDGDRDRDGPFFDSFVGVDLAQASQLPITVVAGRLPAAGSLVEVAVTEGYLERLRPSPEAPEVIGTEIVMGTPRRFSRIADPPVRGRWVRAVIVGVVAQEAAPGQVLGSIQAARLARDFSVAGGGLGRRLTVSTSPYTGLFVVADGLDQVGTVRRDITAIGYATSAPENLIASVQRYLRVVEIVLAAIGIIGLVVASLGVASALLAAVRERRREIGTLKAIGARDRDVLRVFLAEAAAIGLLGGSIGSLAGWVIARAVAAVVNGYLAGQGLIGVRLGFSLPIALGCVVGSMMLSLLSGWVPARRAAALPAREAMEAI